MARQPAKRSGPAERIRAAKHSRRGSHRHILATGVLGMFGLVAITWLGCTSITQSHVTATDSLLSRVGHYMQDGWDKMECFHDAEKLKEAALAGGAKAFGGGEALLKRLPKHK